MFGADLPDFQGKIDLLNASGFSTDSTDLLVWYNREARKLFSQPWVDHHDPDALRQAIGEDNRGDGWWIYFDQPTLSAAADENLRKLMAGGSQEPRDVRYAFKR